MSANSAMPIAITMMGGPEQLIADFMKATCGCLRSRVGLVRALLFPIRSRIVLNVFYTSPSQPKCSW